MRSVSAMLAVLLALLALPITAQPIDPLPPATPSRDEAAASRVPIPPASPAATPTLTATDLNAWLDGYMPYALATGDIAGAVVVVVKDGQVLTQKGYGYSDVAKRTPVDPNRTLFRPGSVSKLFTWTAVMQLVEQGKLDLDRDVNDYLDFKIPPYQGKPITMRQIMTHTPGFEEVAKDIMYYDPKRITPLGDYLKTHLPARIYAPGTTPAYSNYATSLAGYVVERISGQSFDDYVDRNIFAPLGMTHSTFRQPLPPQLAPLMSKGYARASDDGPRKFEIVGPSPAGSLSATGADMGRFMIAHLQKGQFGGNSILKPETAEQMHNSPLTMLPPLNRMELGFFETNINGRDVIAHLGDTQDFHTSLHLFRNDNIGFYVSFNSAGKQGASGDLRAALFEGFADRYLPGPNPGGRVPAKQAAEHARMMAGNWISSRRSETSFFSAFSLPGQITVGVGPKGELSIPALMGLNGMPRRWVEVAPFVWKDADGHEMLAAKVVDGKVVRWSIGQLSPFIVFERAPWYMDSAWLLPLLYVSLAAMLLTALSWPIAAILRRRFASPLALEGTQLRAHRLIRISAIATLVTLVGWVVLVSMMESNLDMLTSGTDVWLWLLQILGFVAFVGGFLVAVWHLWVVWKAKRSWWAKLWSVVLLIAAATVLWIGLAFNLIHFGVTY